MSHEVSTPTVDTRLDVLAHPERRRLLAALLETGPATEVPVAPERDAGDALRIAMHHVHVPKLVAAGVVVRGERPQHVRRGPAFDAVVPLLRATAGDGDAPAGRRA